MDSVKSTQRQYFQQKIRNTTPSCQSVSLSEQFSSRLCEWPIWRKNSVVAGFAALPGEPSLEAFFRKHSDLRFVFPYMPPKEQSAAMHFVFLSPEELKQASHQESGIWEKAPWGGQQPVLKTTKNRGTHRLEYTASDIDIFLVPGLAFDRAGRRLGRGGGHYDRALSQAKGLKVGLARSCQISNEELPEESHDIRMDAVVTDCFILFPLKESSYFKGVY